MTRNLKCRKCKKFRLDVRWKGIRKDCDLCLRLAKMSNKELAIELKTEWVGRKQALAYLRGGGK